MRPTLPREPGPDGRRSILIEPHRPLSSYLTAALPLDFQLRHCAEPHVGRSGGGQTRADESGGGELSDDESRGAERVTAAVTQAKPPMPTEVCWELLDHVPAAAVATAFDVPSIVVLHLQLAPPLSPGPPLM